MRRPFVIFVFLCGISICIALLVVATASPTPKCHKQISPAIVRELKDIVDLVPVVVIDELIAKHYITDGEFRTALKFVRSSSLTQLVDRVQQVDEVCEILLYLHLTNATQPQPQINAFDLYDFVEAPTYHDLDLVLLEPAERQQQRDNYVYRSLGTFNSFVRELCDHLPRADYVRVITEKRHKSAAFDDFYRALRSPQLRAMVDAAMKSENLAFAIKTLKNHALDPDGLKAIVFDVISWGPAV